MSFTAPGFGPNAIGLGFGPSSLSSPVSGASAFSFATQGNLTARQGQIQAASAFSFSTSGTLRVASSGIVGGTAFSFSALGNLRAATTGAALSAFGFSASGNLAGRGAMSGSTVFDFAATARPSADVLVPVAGGTAFSFQAMGTLRAAAAPGTVLFSFVTFGALSGRGSISGTSEAPFGASGTVSSRQSRGGQSAFRFSATGTMQDAVRSLSQRRSAFFPESLRAWQIKPGDVLDYALLWTNELQTDERIENSTWSVDGDALEIRGERINPGRRTLLGQEYPVSSIAIVTLTVNTGEISDLVKVQNTVTLSNGQTITATRYVQIVALYSDEQTQAA